MGMDASDPKRPTLNPEPETLNFFEPLEDAVEAFVHLRPGVEGPESSKHRS